MLVTHPRNRMENHPYLLDKGEMLWEMVQMELSKIYVFISYALEEEGVWISENAMLWQLPSVLSFCCGIQENPRKQLKQVSVLIPPHITESKQWEMTALEEIWLATHATSQRSLVVFIAKNGKRFAEQSVDDLSDDAFEKIDCLITV